MKAINCRVTPVADYVLNVCNLGKGDLDKLNMIVKSVLRRERDIMEDNHGMRLYSKRRKDGRGLRSFK